jgi:prepilin-type N-terminal cleavage/methylation domain-containing protein
MKMYRNQNGFTLVELMIAMVGASILALIVATILFMTYRSWRTDNEYARMRRDIAFAMQLMAKEVRISSYNGITVSTNSLLCPTNAMHGRSTVFTKSTDKLTYSINGTAPGTLITKELSVFTPQPTNNGVLLKLVLVNADGSIAITNETFIYPRN